MEEDFRRDQNDTSIIYSTDAESCRGNGYLNSTWEYYYVIRDRCHGVQKPLISVQT